VIRRVALAGSPWRTFSTRSGFAVYCGSSPTKVGKVRKTLTARRRRVHRGHAAGLTRRVWRNGPLVGRKLCRCISQPRPFGEFGNGRSCFVIGDGLSWLARLGSRMSLRPMPLLSIVLNEAGLHARRSRQISSSSPGTPNQPALHVLDKKAPGLWAEVATVYTKLQAAAWGGEQPTSTEMRELAKRLRAAGF
jgi:hypothetical protein